MEKEEWWTDDRIHHGESMIEAVVLMGIAESWYAEHYRETIGPALSREQKRDLAKRISDLALLEPLAFTGRDYAEMFPELAPLVHVPVDGLYLAAILEGLASDLMVPSEAEP